MRDIIATDQAPKAIGPYSQAVRASGFIFTSGQVALDPATQQVVAGDVAVQTDRVLKNLSAVLSAAAVALSPEPAGPCWAGSKSRSIEIRSAVTRAHSVLTDGTALPRSTWEIRLGEQSTRRASSLAVMPSSIRRWRSLVPMSAPRSSESGGALPSANIRGTTGAILLAQVLAPRCAAGAPGDVFNGTARKLAVLCRSGPVSFAGPERRRQLLLGRSGLAMDLERGEALADRHQLDGIDVHVGGLARRPLDRGGDVLGGQRPHSGVHGGGPLAVAAEAHGGELGTAAQPGFDAGDPDPAVPCRSERRLRLNWCTNTFVAP